jgi:hypothetical protein
MPNSLKILGQVNPSANAQTNVYVVPASTAAFVNSINITNLGSTNASYSIIVVPSTDNSSSPLPKHFVIRGASLPGDDEALLDFVMTLPAGTVLAANSNQSIAISAFGVEIT